MKEISFKRRWIRSCKITLEKSVSLRQNALNGKERARCLKRNLAYSLVKKL